MKELNKMLILSSGITGLSSGVKNSWFIYEANSISGCISAPFTN